ncbi:MAG: VIT domain-containing protein [Bradymonadaceae bacterium]
MKTSYALLFVLFALSSPFSAYADTLRSTLGEPVTEVSHSVTLSVEGGIATYVVRRTFANAGESHDEAVLSVIMPTGAVATGLRIRAGAVWYEGDLLPADEAAAKYTELTGMGVFDPLDPALLAWETSSSLHLRVFPVPPGGTATLEYTLTAPLSWKNGEAITHYPRGGGGPSLSPVVLQFLEHSAELFVDERRVTFEQPVVLTAARQSSHAELRLRSNEPAIVGRMGYTDWVHLSSERPRRFTKIEYDLPARLSEMPKEAKVVFLIDRSRSVGERLMQAQLDVIEGFASYLPDAHFELVMVDRAASSLHGDFITREKLQEVIGALRESGVMLKNGSNLDQGLELGRKLLEDADGPRFIIAFTDDNLRRSWDTHPVAESTGITTHVVVLDQGFERDDAHRLAPVAHREGGILVRAGITSRLEVEVEHLVRPIRLDHVSIVGTGDHISHIHEGTSYRFFKAVDKLPRGTLRAKLWSRSIEVNPQRRAAFDRATAGWVFSHDLHEDLEEEDMMELAIYAGAVSPVTSYLAIEPGVRPSVAGMDRSGMGGLGLTGSGSGGAGYGLAQGSVQAPRIDLDPEPCRGLHPNQRAQVTVHTTTIEVVDVVATTANEFTECIVESVWAITLPLDYHRYEYRTQNLAF